ncbi:MAG: zinc ABC transporter substrate-binding protein [Deltaproteobacteria bacterium]|nr:zinc ABC transporter substrate-binding protein [Deltaproteobacteria bacterium]
MPRILALLLISGFLAAPTLAPAQGLPVGVTLLPQAWLARQVGGDLVQVQVLVGSGQDPHQYQASPRQVATLSQARLYFRSGAPLEDFILPKLQQQNPQMVVVDTLAGIKLLAAPEHHHGEAAHPGEARHESEATGEHHEGEAAGEHPGEMRDFHVWLSPRLAARQAATMAQALEQADPVHAAEYQANLAKLTARLSQLDATLTRLLAPYKGRAFLVFHPAFGYFAQAYGLRQLAMEVEGKEPTARELASILDRARQERVTAIFVEPQFSQKSAATLAQALGVRVVTVDPLSPNYESNLESLGRTMAHTLR